ncbi:TIGR01777 family oxidoreductase [Leucobacter chromiireducens]|uniref:TIGR01777 family oxidoreductase n=1 Tax=Leucobacter chromiireducens TaxID=283877 RepID=UPI000F63D511|nr:TIGR01777 family oxidoreductase [Leucobacter chromiireducens]
MQRDRVIIAGASGLIGGALSAALRADGVAVERLVRRAPRAADETEWRPGAAPLDPELLRGATAIVNLCGASIGRLPWTPRYQRELRASRLDPTRTIAAAARQLGADAPHIVSASAVGFYGDRPGERLTETSAVGTTFLAELSAEWERAAREAGDAAPLALIRTAPVLHPESVLKPMILLTRFGLGGPLGGGEQIWPWISLRDEVRAIRHIIDHRLTGPVNLSGPKPASANEIGRALAAELHRPFLVPAPRWALRLGLGRAAADSLLLSDANVVPAALLDSGFTFTSETAEHAVQLALGPAAA